MAGEFATSLPGRYRTVRRLGAGGSDRVLLVEDHGAPPLMKALKVLHGGASRVALTSFRDEFRVLATADQGRAGRRCTVRHR